MGTRKRVRGGFTGLLGSWSSRWRVKGHKKAPSRSVKCLMIIRPEETSYLTLRHPYEGKHFRRLRTRCPGGPQALGLGTGEGEVLRVQQPEALLGG